MISLYKRLQDAFGNDLLARFGSPLYVYDYAVLESRCASMAYFKHELETSLGKKVSMHYSPKANNNPAILSVVKDSGLCVDCMSPFELAINKSCGFTPDEILYVCNNIDSDEMKLVHDNKVLICLDSISQVNRWGILFPGSDIMVRLNPGVIGVGHSDKVITSGSKTKFGISEANIPELLEIAKKHHLHIVGTHQHLGSLFLNDKIDNYIAGVKAGLRLVKECFDEVTIVDLGGGFGVPYKPDEKPLDLSLVANKLESVLSDFIASYPSVQEFKFEPGRFIPCESGFLVGRVNAIKHENGTYWIGTDLGMNQLVRPSMYDSYHEISVSGSGDEVIANICGNVCESGDIIAKERKFKLPAEGSIIVVHNAGAYGYSMASNYTGRPRPAEILVRNGEYTLIRRRESLEDMMHNIVW